MLDLLAQLDLEEHLALLNVLVLQALLVGPFLAHSGSWEQCLYLLACHQPQLGGKTSTGIKHNDVK